MNIGKMSIGEGEWGAQMATKSTAASLHILYMNNTCQGFRIFFRKLKAGIPLYYDFQCD